MEKGVLGEEVGLCFEPGAAFSKHLREVVQGVEGPIGHGGVGERPEPLGGLQLWGIGGQGDGLNTWGLSLPSRDMKAGAVLDHEHVMVGVRADTVGEGGHDGGVRLFAQDRHQPEPALAGFWIDKRVQIEPFIGGLDRTGERLTRGRPDPAANRFETQPVFVQAPQGHASMETLRMAERLR